MRLMLSVTVAAAAFAIGSCSSKPAETSARTSAPQEAANEDAGDRSCTYTNGGPRPVPPIPAGANQAFLSKGGQTAQLSDTFDPVWGRVCLQNGIDSILEATVKLADGSMKTVKIQPTACADFKTSLASVMANCAGGPPQTCPTYTYTRMRKCSGDAHAVPEEFLRHESHLYYRFDVNPSAYDFMRKAVPVRASRPWPATFVISDTLATVEICKEHWDWATVTAYQDSAGAGPVSKIYRLWEQPQCFPVQGRNLTVSLDVPYPPHNMRPPTVLNYRILSF